MLFKNFCLGLALIIPYFIASTFPQLVLRACCNNGTSCKTFQRPEEMFGMSCCGKQPMNDFEEICCDNVTKARKQGAGFVNRCCGNETLRYDQTCCQGIVHDTPNGECCGAQVYSRNSHDVLCCNGTLNTRVDPGSTCCGNKPYDGGIKENCCGGQVFLKELFDGCCPVLNAKTPQYKQFNLKTHLCCDVPIARESNTKCCYLRNSNGTFTPKSYDFTTSCCAYPFKTITQKTGGSCIPNAPAVQEATTQGSVVTTGGQEGNGGSGTTTEPSSSETTTSSGSGSGE